jgi:hypothetical protein
MRNVCSILLIQVSTVVCIPVSISIKVIRHWREKLLAFLILALGSV